MMSEKGEKQATDRSSVCLPSSDETFEGLEEKKLRALRTLAGGVADDFKDVLAAIRGYVELAQLDIPKRDPTRKVLSDALVAIERGDDMAMDMLEYSRSASRSRKPQKIDTIVKTAVDQFVKTVPARIKVETDLSPDIGLTLVNAAQIRQIVTTLCTNADQAILDDGGKIKVELTSTRLEDRTVNACGDHLDPGSYVVLRVTDSGTGMDPETMERIFEPYFSRRETGAGTGMGLAFVYSIVHACRGAVLVESAVQKGSVFTVLLPEVTE